MREVDYYNLMAAARPSDDSIGAIASRTSLPAIARLGKVMGVSRGKTLKALNLRNNADNRAWYEEVTADI